MADQTISQLSEAVTYNQTDLFVILTNPASTPITKRITSRSLFGGISAWTANGISNATAIRAVLTSNGVQTSAGHVTAADFQVRATGTATNTTTQFAATFGSTLNASAIVKGDHAAALFTVDMADAATAATNTFAAVFSFANTVVRTTNAQAFFKCSEASTNADASVQRFVELTGVSSNTAGNATAFLITSASTGATHKMRVRVNGTDYWMVLSANTL